ncbi:MAG: hypothetical protein LBF70_02060 [Holosporales bacterium]|jgi:hypothetical protein|nr:hypothetical protein [Holosporales bacterium]
MNVKCPYCGCCYKLNHSLLRDPIGNENLGYGWWLRCYKCNKKWWLRNSTFISETETELKADQQAKINNLSRLIKIKKERKAEKNFAWILMIIFLMVTACFAYLNKDVFYRYMAKKIEHISKSFTSKLVMLNIRYVITPSSGEDLINVKGTIKNDDRTVAQINGIRITIFDKELQIKTWDTHLNSNAILPGDSINFSINNSIEKNIENIRVEVSII